MVGKQKGGLVRVLRVRDNVGPAHTNKENASLLLCEEGAYIVPTIVKVSLRVPRPLRLCVPLRVSRPAVVNVRCGKLALPPCPSP